MTGIHKYRSAWCWKLYGCLSFPLALFCFLGMVIFIILYLGEPYEGPLESPPPTIIESIFIKTAFFSFPLVWYASIFQKHLWNSKKSLIIRNIINIAFCLFFIYFGYSIWEEEYTYFDGKMDENLELLYYGIVLLLFLLLDTILIQTGKQNRN